MIPDAIPLLARVGMVPQPAKTGMGAIEPRLLDGLCEFLCGWSSSVSRSTGTFWRTVGGKRLSSRGAAVGILGKRIDSRFSAKMGLAIGAITSARSKTRCFVNAPEAGLIG